MRTKRMGVCVCARARARKLIHKGELARALQLMCVGGSELGCGLGMGSCVGGYGLVYGWAVCAGVCEDERAHACACACVRCV